MNVDLFEKLVREGKNPVVLKLLWKSGDEAAISEKYKLLTRIPDSMAKLKEAWNEEVKRELALWDIPDMATPKTLAQVGEFSKGRLVLTAENYSRYYDRILTTEESPILEVELKSKDGTDSVLLDICGREEDMTRKRNAQLFTAAADVIDYDLSALAGYFRVSNDKKCSLPRAVAIGAASTTITKKMSDFLAEQFVKQFADFF